MFENLTKILIKQNEIYTPLDKPLTKEQFAWIIGEINSYVDRHSIITDLYYSYLSKNIMPHNV